MLISFLMVFFDVQNKRGGGREGGGEGGREGGRGGGTGVRRRGGEKRTAEEDKNKNRPSTIDRAGRDCWQLTNWW
jgi:hypothetical protein